MEHRGRGALAGAVLLDDALGVGAEAVLVVLVGHLDGLVAVDGGREVVPVAGLLALLAVELRGGPLGLLDTRVDDLLPALDDDGGIEAPLALLLDLAQDRGPVDDTGLEEVLVSKPDEDHDVLVNLAQEGLAEASEANFLLDTVDRGDGLLLRGGISLGLGALVGAVVGMLRDCCDPFLDLLGILLELGFILGCCEEVLVGGTFQTIRECLDVNVFKALFDTDQWLTIKRDSLYPLRNKQAAARCSHDGWMRMCVISDTQITRRPVMKNTGQGDTE